MYVTGLVLHFDPVTIILNEIEILLHFDPVTIILNEKEVSDIP
jgi:hypothetical protein